MPKKEIRFGDYIRDIRIHDKQELRQSDVAKELNLSLTVYNDTENNYRVPLNDIQMEKFAELFNLTDEQKARMYDLASIETGKVPADIDEIFFDEAGKYVVQLLREHKAGNIDEEFWKKAIREAEAAKEKRERGEIYDKNENNEI